MRSFPQNVRFVAAHQPDLSDGELVLAKEDYLALMQEMATWSSQAPIASSSRYLNRFDFLISVSDPNVVHVIRKAEPVTGVIVTNRFFAEKKIVEYQEPARLQACSVGILADPYSARGKRNSEIEADLARVFGGEWCIADWCPLDGIYCSWADHAPVATLEEMIEGLRRACNDEAAAYLASKLRK